MQPEVLGKVLGLPRKKGNPLHVPIYRAEPTSSGHQDLGLPPLLHYGSPAFQTGTQIQGFKENPAN